MTKKEAITMLIRIKDRILAISLADFEVADAQKKIDSLNMAIEVLEQEIKIEESTEWFKDMLEEGHFNKMREPTQEERKSVNDYIEFISEVIDEATNALEQEPCEDTISRQVVKEQMIKYGFHAPDMTVTEFVEDMDMLPPVQPKRKTGHWIRVGDNKLKCSECDCYTRYVEPNYCSNCGAKMDGYCSLFEVNVEREG